MDVATGDNDPGDIKSLLIELREELAEHKTALQVARVEFANLKELVVRVRDIVEGGDGLAARITNLDGSLRSINERVGMELESIRAKAKDSQALLREGTPVSLSILARVIMLEDLMKVIESRHSELIGRMEARRQMAWGLLVALIATVVGGFITYAIALREK